jgi:hypothetical protein
VEINQPSPKSRGPTDTSKDSGREVCSSQVQYVGPLDAGVENYSSSHSRS